MVSVACPLYLSETVLLWNVSCALVLSLCVIYHYLNVM